MKEKSVNHYCSNCHKKTAVCGWTSDSDGASYTWIKWSHDCVSCGFHEEKEAQYFYDREEIDYCQVCGEKYGRDKKWK